MSKIAIILYAEPGTQDAMGRVAHTLLYTKELKESGHDVQLIFDGGGTKWISELSQGKHPLSSLFEMVKASGAIYGICKFCIGAFGGDAEEVKKTGLTVIGEYMDHPSVAALVEKGYQIITL